MKWIPAFNPNMYAINLFSKSFTVLALLISTQSFGQTGPGGVGDASSNVFWLKADALSGLSDGDPVRNWQDQSGNNNHFNQSTSANQPTYKTSRFKGEPAIRFDGVDDWLGDTLNFPEKDFTQFVIFRTLNNDGNGVLTAVTDPVSPNAGSHDRQFGLNNKNLSHRLWNQEVINSSGSFNNNKAQLSEIIVDSPSGQTLYADGSSVASGTKGYSDFDYESGMVIGGHTYWGHFEGEVPEIIYYNFVLNDAQRIIVENYLSAKYSIDISGSGNDYFAHDANYGNAVAGIGRATPTDTHTSAKSDNILKISSPGDLNANDEYLLFGHNDDGIGSWGSNNVPSGGNIKRLSREWRADKTGTPGKVKITIDTTQFPARPNNEDKFVIMVDDDGDFSSNANVYELTSPGNNEIYERDNINIDDGDYLAIGIVDPKLAFTADATGDFETNTNPEVQVQLNYIPESNVTVDYATSDLTATASNDYTATSGTLTVPAGQDTANIGLTINNDTQTEPTETFEINLSNPSGNVEIGTKNPHVYDIKDDDNPRKIYFSNSTSSGGEGTSPEAVQVAINNVDNTNPTTVDYQVTGGTATGGGTDYTISAGTLTISAGNTSDTFAFSVNDDNLYEKDETIEITLSNPSNSNLSTSNPTVHTHTITDNDSKPTVQYKNTSSSGGEGITPVYFPVNLSAKAGQEITVDYQVKGGTATGSGNDYALSGGTLTINEGETQDSFSMTVNDDAVAELDETVNISLRNPSGANLGVDSVFTYTIVDNDQFGHTGPGGVGNKSNNLVWLKADELSGLSQGNSVSSWSDESGNNNAFSQSTNSDQPTYQTNVINNKPALRFDGQDDWMGIALDIPETNFSQFVVFQTRNNDTDGAAWTATGSNSASSGSHDRQFGINSSNLSQRLYSSQVINSSSNFNDNSPHITSAHVNNGVGQRIKADGSEVGNGNKDGSNFTGQSHVIIGGHTHWDYFEADIPEIIYYKTLLDTTQQIIVANYLSSKYGITISNDHFSYDANFGHDVAGIGRENQDDFHWDSKGPGRVRINNPSNLDDGDYLLWGHDNATTSTNNTSDVPSGVKSRFNRVWRVDETGNVGNVKVHMDLSNQSISEPDSLVLLIDGDGTFSDASIHTQGVNYSSGTVSFEQVDFSAGDYFTVGTKSTNDPLPVELFNFRVSKQEETVQIQWQTASEINNDYFTVQRSEKGETFDSLTRVDGAGNSQQTRSYEAVDSQPFTGTSYYRLKQTDFDGSVAYSTIKTITFESQSSHRQIKVYPNPVAGPLQFKIMGGANNPATYQVQITSIQGQVHYRERMAIQPGQIITIPEAQSLKPGIYFLRCQNQEKTYRAKFVVD